MTTDYLIEEPPDNAILANDDLSETYARHDAGADELAHWIACWDDRAGEAFTWSQLAGRRWQRLYRQSELDARLAAQREQTRTEARDDGR